MSISAQNSYPSIKTDMRQGNRRCSDIEQQAYAAVGRRFAADEGPLGKGRILRVVLAGAASIMVVMLVTVIALLSYENINTAHARKLTTVEPPASQAAGVAAAEESKPVKPARPVVIIDEKEDAPLRAVAAPAPVQAPVPALVLLSPAEHGAAPAPAARPVAINTAPRLREHARAAAPAGKHPVLKAAKTAHPPTARKGGRHELRNDARNAARKTPPAVKRKPHLASMAAPSQQGASGNALGTLLAYASVQRRYLAQPLPLLASRLKAPRRRQLAER